MTCLSTNGYPFDVGNEWEQVYQLSVFREYIASIYSVRPGIIVVASMRPYTLQKGEQVQQCIRSV